MRGTLTLLNKWDARWLEIAGVVSTWSKDPSTKIGAIAVKDKRLVSTGYNGFPRGIQDYDDRWNNREEKYKYVVHAEMNCIYNASFNGVSLVESDFYVHGLPVCSDCAKGIIQVGVRTVYMPQQDIPDHWIDSWDLTRSMFDEAGVEWKFLPV